MNSFRIRCKLSQRIIKMFCNLNNTALQEKTMNMWFNSLWKFKVQLHSTQIISIYAISLIMHLKTISISRKFWTILLSSNMMNKLRSSKLKTIWIRLILLQGSIYLNEKIKNISKSEWAMQMVVKISLSLLFQII